MTYDTDNIAIAAGLRTVGHSLSHIKMDGRKATFSFDSSVQDLANQIFEGKIKVDAITFHNELRRLSGLAKTMTERT